MSFSGTPPVFMKRIGVLGTSKYNPGKHLACLEIGSALARLDVLGGNKEMASTVPGYVQQQEASKHSLIDSLAKIGLPHVNVQLEIPASSSGQRQTQLRAIFEQVNAYLISSNRRAHLVFINIAEGYYYLSLTQGLSNPESIAELKALARNRLDRIESYFEDGNASSRPPLVDELFEHLTSQRGRNDISFLERKLRDLSLPLSIALAFTEAKDELRLRTGEEHRNLIEVLRSTPMQGVMAFDQIPSVRIRDVNTYLGRTVSPYHVFHFSGHGTQQAILFENANGNSQPLNPDDFGALLAEHSIQLAVLNCCHSASLGQTVANHLQYAIGMECTIADDTAISFSRTFYESLGAGTDVETAFKRTARQIRLEYPNWEGAPKLFKRQSETERAASATAATPDRPAPPATTALAQPTAPAQPPAPPPAPAPSQPPASSQPPAASAFPPLPSRPQPQYVAPTPDPFAYKNNKPPTSTSTSTSTSASDAPPLPDISSLTVNEAYDPLDRIGMLGTVRYLPDDPKHRAALEVGSLLGELEVAGGTLGDVTSGSADSPALLRIRENLESNLGVLELQDIVAHIVFSSASRMSAELFVEEIYRQISERMGARYRHEELVLIIVGWSYRMIEFSQQASAQEQWRSDMLHRARRRLTLLTSSTQVGGFRAPSAETLLSYLKLGQARFSSLQHKLERLSQPLSVAFVYQGAGPGPNGDPTLAAKYSSTSFALGKTPIKDRFTFVDLPDCRLQKLDESLDENPFHILHFIGRDSPDGFYFGDLPSQQQQAQQIATTPRVLGKLLADGGVPLVILNTSQAATHGQALADEIRHVICLDWTAEDSASAKFIWVLYERLGAGFGVKEAFDEATRTMEVCGAKLFENSSRPGRRMIG